MDIQKQIEYWITSAQEDLEAGRLLLAKGHLRHAMFLAHLAVEKTLKARVTKITKDVPPRIHKLERLAELAGIDLRKNRRKILVDLEVYQQAGRYPDPSQAAIDKKTASRDFRAAEEMIKWLKSQL